MNPLAMSDWMDLEGESWDTAVMDYYGYSTGEEEDSSFYEGYENDFSSEEDQDWSSDEDEEEDKSK